MFIGGPAMAGISMICESPDFLDRVYQITEGANDIWRLEVRERVEDPRGCDSRWGCDVEEKPIYQEKMKATDWQGELTLEGKRGYIVVADWEKAYYSYPVRNSEGRFENKTIQLKCE